MEKAMKDLKKKYIFTVLFMILGYILLQIPFSQLVGSNVKFTLFDFFAPIAGAFLGPIAGVASVAAVQAANLGVHHVQLDTFTVLRFFTTLFATLYFALMTRKYTRSYLMLIVPVVAIIAFLAHPVGRSVWYFSLFWTVPLLSFFKKDQVLVRSLGSTMTAHAVGGAVWIWSFPTTASYWNNLVPIVIRERVVFALGIAVSYYALDSLLNYLIAKKKIELFRVLSPTFS